MACAKTIQAAGAGAIRILLENHITFLLDFFTLFHDMAFLRVFLTVLLTAFVGLSLFCCTLQNSKNKPLLIFH